MENITPTMSEISLKDDNYPTLKLKLIGHKKLVTDIAFNPINEQFASSSDDNTIMIWNNMSHSRCYCFSDGHDDIVTSIQYSPDGRILASASQDKHIRFWIPTINGGSVRFKAHTSHIRTLCFSPDSTNLITGSNDKSIKLWDVNRRQFISSFTGHNNWVQSVKFSQDGQLIASCSDDRTVRIWDKNSGKCVHIFTSTKGSPTSLSIKYSNSVIVGMNSGSVRLYDIRTKKIQQHYKLHDYTTGICWHPTANYFATCGKDGQMIITDVIEGRPIYTINGHENGINCVQFNLNGNYLASGGVDRFVMVWKVNLCSDKTN